MYKLLAELNDLLSTNKAKYRINEQTRRTINHIDTKHIF